jgi:hypothetical protein
VNSGHLNEAIRLWREEVEPAAEGLPGYVLFVESDDNTLVVVAYWETKSHDDAFATT